MMLEALRAAARPTPTESDGLDATLVLQTEDEAAQAPSALAQYFQGDERRKAVHLIVGGQEAGYLNREDFYGPAISVKSYGSADAMRLLGVSPHHIHEFRCPVPDCKTRKRLLFFDDDAPPFSCDRHPGQRLRHV